VPPAFAPAALLAVEDAPEAFGSIVHNREQ
jgi:hypothetical protein